ncbi:hypothetical protein [Nostoc sp.]
MNSVRLGSEYWFKIVLRLATRFRQYTFRLIAPTVPKETIDHQRLNQ